MEFSIEGYKHLLDLLKTEQYEFADYHNWATKDKCVILRHDVDDSLTDALKLARLEFEGGGSSTYFVLVTSDIYNAFSAKNRRIMREIQGLGHEIGLHFDEVAYESNDPVFIKKMILREAALLSEAIDSPITTVSMHRPSAVILESDLEIPGMVNSYSKTFFKDFKYVSDSRMRWREPIEQIIRKGDNDRLHVLTHAFWYKDKPMKAVLAEFIEDANNERYCALKENFSNLEDVFSDEEALRWS